MAAQAAPANARARGASAGVHAWRGADTARAGALRRIAREVCACRRCASMRGRSPVPGQGPSAPTIFFLAEAPGRLGAARTGVPLQGDRSGRLFHRMLAECGLGPDEVFVTNAVKCNPLDARGRNRRPTAAEVAACGGHWRAELAAVRPRLAVALGDLASRQLTGLPLRAARGRLLRGALGVPAWVLPHPGAVCRHVVTLEAYRRDWAAAMSALRTLWAAPGR